MFQVRLLAQGLSDLVAAKGEGKSNIAEIFKDYTESVFPFTKGQKSAKDEEMKAVMKREVEKGMLTFEAHPVSFLQKKAKTMQLPDDFKQRLADRAAAKGKK